jgi:hypothetical protein
MLLFLLLLSGHLCIYNKFFEIRVWASVAKWLNSLNFHHVPITAEVSSPALELSMVML